MLCNAQHILKTWSDLNVPHILTPTCKILHRPFQVPSRICLHICNNIYLWYKFCLFGVIWRYKPKRVGIQSTSSNSSSQLLTISSEWFLFIWGRYLPIIKWYQIVLFSRPKGKKSESGASDERRAYLSYASLELTTGHKLVEFQRPQLAPINH